MARPRCSRHVHSGPQDLRPDGRCIWCSREAQRNYRIRCRDARRRLVAIEAALAV